MVNTYEQTALADNNPARYFLWHDLRHPDNLGRNLDRGSPVGMFLRANQRERPCFAF